MTAKYTKASKFNTDVEAEWLGYLEEERKYHAAELEVELAALQERHAAKLAASQEENTKKLQAAVNAVKELKKRLSQQISLDKAAKSAEPSTSATTSGSGALVLETEIPLSAKTDA